MIREVKIRKPISSISIEKQFTTYKSKTKKNYSKTWNSKSRHTGYKKKRKSTAKNNTLGVEVKGTNKFPNQSLFKVGVRHSFLGSAIPSNSAVKTAQSPVHIIIHGFFTQMSWFECNEYSNTPIHKCCRLFMLRNFENFKIAPKMICYFLFGWKVEPGKTL